MANYSLNAGAGSYGITGAVSSVPAHRVLAVLAGSYGLDGSLAGVHITFDIVKTGSATLYRGQTNATYTLTITNWGETTHTDDVLVVDTLPDGLTLVSMSGTGWDCAEGTCTRIDDLAAGESYPPITVVVDVDSDAPDSVINTASIAGWHSTTLTSLVSTPITVPARTAVQWALRKFEVKFRGEERS